MSGIKFNDDNVRQIKVNGLLIKKVKFDGYLVHTRVDPPIVKAQPKDETVDLGKTATLIAEFYTYDGSMSYQWYKGYKGDTSDPVIGGTSTSLDVVRSTVGDFKYWCRANNEFGERADTNTATLHVVNPVSKPTFTTHPASGVVEEGDSFVMNVSVDWGGESGSYIWYVDGVAQDFSNSPSFDAAKGRSAGSYSIKCKATNTAGYAYSNEATLTVKVKITPPAFITQPSSGKYTIGDQVHLHVTVRWGGDTTDLKLQWFKNGSSLSGQTSADLSFVADEVGSDTYFCRATNSAGSIDSKYANIQTSQPIYDFLIKRSSNGSAYGYNDTPAGQQNGDLHTTFGALTPNTIDTHVINSLWTVALFGTPVNEMLIGFNENITSLVSSVTVELIDFGKTFHLLEPYYNTSSKRYIYSNVDNWLTSFWFDNESKIVRAHITLNYKNKSVLRLIAMHDSIGYINKSQSKSIESNNDIDIISFVYHTDGTFQFTVKEWEPIEYLAYIKDRTETTVTIHSEGGLQRITEKTKPLFDYIKNSKDKNLELIVLPKL